MGGRLRPHMALPAKTGIVFSRCRQNHVVARAAFYAIGHTLQSVGFHTLPLHNQILTLGEWGWYICSVNLETKDLKVKLLEPEAIPVETRWYNEAAPGLMVSFGKTYADTIDYKVNSMENPLVYQYYLKGNWELE